MTPAEDALHWLLSGDAADIDNRCTPALVAAVGREPMAELVRELRGAAVVRSRADGDGVVAAVRRDGLGSVHLLVEPQPPHRIVTLSARPIPQDAPAWEAIVSDLRERDWCTSELDASIASAVAEARDRAQVVGMVAAVLREGRLVHQQCLGAASIGRPLLMSTRTVFRAGSITKVVTALTLLRLAERGLVSLDDPVNTHLRAFRVAPETITVRQVLAHRAGLPRHQGDLQGARSMTELIGDELHAVTAPGTYRYSNVGYGMLGQLIADVTHSPYAAAVDHEIFDPLGMLDSSIAPDGVKGPVSGYENLGGLFVPAEPVRIVEEGAGALCSTAEDLARLAIHVCAERERLREAFEQQLGFAVLDGRTVWHNGGLSGWRSAWYTVPDDGLAVILLANTDTAPLDELARSVLRRLQS